MTFRTQLLVENNPVIDEIWISTTSGVLLTYHSLTKHNHAKRDMITGMFSAIINYAITNFACRLSIIETDDVRFSFYYLTSFKLFVVAKSSCAVAQAIVFKVLKQFVRDFMSIFKADVLRATQNGNVTEFAQSNAIVDLDRGLNWHETTIPS